MLPTLFGRCVGSSSARPVFVLFAAALGPWLPAHPQTCWANPQSSISTDRPQITNSSIVVPCGSLQLENGLAVTSSSGHRAVDVPETSVRYGFAKNTELRFMVPDYFSYASSGAGSSSGFGDLSLGLKRQLGGIRGFDLSVIPSLSLPTGAGTLSSHGYDPTVQLPWTHSLAKNWTVAGQFALGWPTQPPGRNLMGQSSMYFDRQVNSPLDAYVEYSGVFSQRGSPQHLIDFGMAYKASLHQQLDVHCGFGLSSAAPDYSIGFGYSVRFQVIGTK